MTTCYRPDHTLEWPDECDYCRGKKWLYGDDGMAKDCVCKTK